MEGFVDEILAAAAELSEPDQLSIDPPRRREIKWHASQPDARRRAHRVGNRGGDGRRAGLTDTCWLTH